MGSVGNVMKLVEKKCIVIRKNCIEKRNKRALMIDEQSDDAQCKIVSVTFRFTENNISLGR
jgi:hypothetical protein